MNSESLSKRSLIIILIIIILFGLFIQYPYMNEFPSFIHAWSQSDRYSIALGFVNNDLDLFHPETFIYNKQFPHKWNYAYDNTITSVYFPILEYVVAIISSLIYVVYMRFKNKDVKPEQNRKRLSLWIFLCVVFFGYFLFTIAMAKQFKNHDYYFIDTYFLPILLLFCMIFNCLPKVDNYKLGMLYCLISAFLL